MPIMTAAAPLILGAARYAAPILIRAAKESTNLGAGATRGDLLKAGLIGAGIDMLGGFVADAARAEPNLSLIHI